MTEQRWERLVHRLEGLAARKPAAYRLRVGMLAGLGFGYLALTLLLLLALIAAIVVLAIATAGAVIKFAWPLLIVVFVVLRALWFRLPEPEGVAVGRDEAPALWELVDETRARLDAPRIHRLLLDDELNAGVVQVPRFGVMGPSRNFLLVGLPLLQAVSEEQFKAVLAHELGHLSGNHSRFAGWIYRLRRTYANVLQALEERESRGIWLFRRFFEWYAPYFAAYSFALARQDEYVADRAAAEATSPGAAAGALVRVDLTARWLGLRYWPELYRSAEREPEPPRNAFTSLGRQLPLPADAAGEDALQAMLAEQTGTADTHPSLVDRLDGLGVSDEDAIATGAERPERSAASALLGASEHDLLARFDERYQMDVDASWRQAHEEARAARERYDALRSAAPAGAEERVELALLTARFEDEDAAVPVFESALEADPDHPVAAHRVGAARLQAGDPSGLELLDRAIEHDPDAVIPSCELAYAFLTERGKADRAEIYRARAEQQAAEFEAAAAERADIVPGDPLDHHGLSEEIVDRLRAVLAAEKRVKRGYLARKAMRHLPDRAPLYLVAVRASRWRDHQELIDRLVPAIGLPGRFIAVTVAGRFKGFKKALGDVPGAEIYRA
jgi:Zn-dependent protease with chaperone function